MHACIVITALAHSNNVVFAGALYHVTSREDRLKFLGVLAEVANRLNWIRVPELDEWLRHPQTHPK